MVAASLPSGGLNNPEYYDALAEKWPERPSRKRSKRSYQRKQERRTAVRVERLDQPDMARMSKALLAAQRELAAAEAERDARHQKTQEDQ